jgi:CheY-like chemotaxis protein
MNETTRPSVILLADDDSDDRLLLQDAITECDWDGDLRCVENGEELLDYLGRRGKYQPPANAPWPGLILLDLNMPRKDGREALRAIKADAKMRQIPVVVLTTSKADTDIATLYELGANSFISKPVNFEGLVEVIRALGRYWFQIVQLPVAR